MTDASERTPLSRLLASLRQDGAGYQASIPTDWLQGRAIYGGLSAALCLQATLNAFDNLPPLRSAQISFIGPAGADVRMEPVMARRGKSTAFINADLSAEGNTAVRATFCFGAARESQLSHVDMPAPDVPGPADCGRFFEDENGRNIGPNFANHFNSRRAAGAMPMSSADTPDFVVWMQHKDPAIDPLIVGLVALADALPPASLACFGEFAPVSSMTWMFDVLSDAPATRDGWWLSRSTAQTIGEGYSSQSMSIWNADGQPIVVGRQNVAVFY